VAPPAVATHEPSGMAVQINTGTITSLDDTNFTISQPGGLSVALGGGFRITYSPTNVTGGNAPATFSTVKFANQGTGWMYERFQIRFSPNFTTGSNSDIKLEEPKSNYSGSGDDATQNDNVDAFAVGGGSSTRLVLGGGLQGPNGHFANLLPNLGDVRQAVLSTGDDAWHTVEVLFGPASAAGRSNGSYAEWVDGVQVADYASVLWRAAGQSPGWVRMLFQPTYGGGTMNPPLSMYWDLNALYISVK
jgi:hypothetical protein